MPCEVEYADEFAAWWETLTEDEQDSVERIILVLMEKGTDLHRPLVDTIKGSLFPNMKELRVQHAGRPLRIFFAFDPLRKAILLIGGDKTGDKRFYETLVPKADAIYAQHLKEMIRDTNQT